MRGLMLLAVALACFACAVHANMSFDDHEEVFADEAPVVDGEGAGWDEGELEFDEEEFTGIAEATSWKRKPAAKKAAPQAAPAAPATAEAVAPTAMPEGAVVGPSFAERVWESAKRRDWTVEACAATVVVAYLANFLYGKGENEAIAKRWLQRYLALYRSEFHLVGYGEARIMKEHHNLFTLAASGRQNCRGAVTELRLASRHDLMAVAWAFLHPEKDYLVIDVPLLQMEPVVAAVLTHAGSPAFVEEHSDIQQMAKVHSFEKLAEDYVCLADNGEVLAQLLSSQVVKTILDNADLVQEIYLTDSHPSFSKSNILHIKLVLPSDLDRLDVLLRMAFFLVDSVPNIRLSKPALAKAKKVRQKAEALSSKELHEKRQEAAQQRKLEKEAKQREKLARMSDEDAEKFLEKERKRKQRRKLAKQKMQVVMG